MTLNRGFSASPAPHKHPVAKPVYACWGKHGMGRPLNTVRLAAFYRERSTGHRGGPSLGATTGVRMPQRPQRGALSA